MAKRFFLFCLLVLSAPAFGGVSFLSNSTMTRLGDFQSYTASPFGAFMAPFFAQSLVGGGFDYDDSMVIQYVTFPNLSLLTWSWPVTPSCRTTPGGATGSICGFNQISYGDYDNGPTNLITPKQVISIVTLTSAHNLTFSGTANAWDVIYDLFLGSTQHGTDLFEVEIFLHSPPSAQSFCAGGSSVGTFTGSGVTWTVTKISQSPPDICFIPSSFADVPSASIDINGMLKYLAAQSVLTGNEWYHGHALGAEMVSGSGSLSYNSLSVTYN